MKLLVDASVAVKWFVEEGGSADAIAILDRGDQCFAPNLIIAEVANALNKKRKLGLAKTDQLVLAMQALPRMIGLVSDIDIVESALDIALELQHPVYDCFYLAASIHIGAPMVTADAIFYKTASHYGYSDVVRLLGAEAYDSIVQISISPDDLTKIQFLTDRVKDTIKFVRDKVKRKEGPLRGLVDSRDLAPAFESPVYHNLRQLLLEIGPERRFDILALLWLGLGMHGQNWEQLREHAKKQKGKSRLTT